MSIESHPCGHEATEPGCGGCDPGAIEFVITDDGVRRPFDPARDMTAPSPLLAASTEQLAAALRYSECHEEVSRKGEAQPCEGIAVAVRIDPNEGGFYPVCSRHTRRPMVRLADLAAALEDR